MSGSDATERCAGRLTLDHSGREARAEGVDQVGRVVYAGHHVHAHATTERRQHLQRLARLLLSRHSPPIGKEAAGARWPGRPTALRSTRGQRAGSAPEEHSTQARSGAARGAVHRLYYGTPPGVFLRDTSPTKQAYEKKIRNRRSLDTPPHNRVLAERLILLSLSKGSRPAGAAKPCAP